MPPETSESGEGGMYCVLGGVDNVVALRTIPVKVCCGELSMTINAMLDDGSSFTLLNQQVADQLQLQGPATKMRVCMLGGRTSQMCGELVTMTVAGIGGEESFSLQALTTARVTGDLRPFDWAQNCGTWEHLGNINFPRLPGCNRVDLLIGSNAPMLHISRQEVVGRVDEPVARLTPLGWTCVGPVGPRGGEEEAHVQCSYFVSQEEQLSEMVRKFWAIEEYQPVKTVKPDEQEAMRIAESTCTQQGERYEIGLPWKTGRLTLPNNYQMARKRLEGTERRLMKKPELAVAYGQVFKKYLSNEYIRKVPKEEVVPDEHWYLPHFPVLREDKSTTKVRVVFNASAELRGISLNSQLHQGPNLQADLIKVLLRFRRRRVALVSDITEMYLQVKLKAEDRSVHRFLWRDLEITEEPDIYEFSRVVFGVTASPFMAQYVAQENARRKQRDLPRAAEVVLSSTYMDDSLDSVDTPEEAIALYHDLITLWKKAGMTARKWCSNCPSVMKQIPMSERMPGIDLQADATVGVKTLGVHWEAFSDCFEFDVQLDFSNQHCTKRELLRKVATIFDPLGLVAAVLITGRILLQKFWLEGLDWDEVASSELREEVVDWFSNVHDLSNVRIPRALVPDSDIVDTQIHVFCDASLLAYGAVAYLRHQLVDGSFSTHMVTAKAKVAPLQAVSIPRLELMAAMVGVRLVGLISEMWELLRTKQRLWSDSMDVLYWIRGCSRNFKPFVSNRVGEIQRQTNPDCWRYVNTKENPADLLSRGVRANMLQEQCLWWTGPGYLQEPEERWPRVALIEGSDVGEEKKAGVKFAGFMHGHPVAGGTSCVPDIRESVLDPVQFSDLGRLVRVAAWVTRFLENCAGQCREKKKSGELSIVEYQDSLMAIVRCGQYAVWSKEIANLQHNKTVAQESKLYKLRPWLDLDCVVRCGSRLEYAQELDWETRNPIIWPRHHHVTMLIVKDAHERVKHAGVNGTLAHVTKRFWIVGGREEISEWIKKCAYCMRRRAKPVAPLLAPLPGIRSQETMRAFEHVSVDYAGPFQVKMGRGKVRAKRWICLFGCLATRAIHLEVAHSLDTDGFLNCLTRFTARRGVPKIVWSDNGTNFVGADREIKELLAELDKGKIQRFTVSDGIEWHFNPPSAPHFNGVHEILVKAAKRAMKVVMGAAELNDEEFLTALISVEGLLNDRPITYQSSDASDLSPLTPNNFLFGMAGSQVAAKAADGTGFSLRKRWRRLQEIVRQFWVRWKQEWLHSLHPRSKWNKDQISLKKDDVVLMAEDNLSRGEWRLGRILETFPGKDGEVRTVDVRVNDKVYRRPVVKLCPLEIQ